MAVICVKSWSVLWSTARDKRPRSSTPWKELVTLNHTAIAYITKCELGQRPILRIRDILTGEIKATKPIPNDLFMHSDILSLFNEKASLQLHPRRDLVYIAVRTKVFFFSATTANCVGRLSLARVSSMDSRDPPFDHGPLRFRFSEHQPKFSPSVRERFFLYQYNKRPNLTTYLCFEYEIPTDEDISTSEARILQSEDQGSEETLVISKVLRIQIYEHYSRGGGWPLHLNPVLKQVAYTSINPPRKYSQTQVRLLSFTRHYPLPGSYDISLEPGKPHDGSIPIEFYPRGSSDALVTKPKQAPGRFRRYIERADCLLPKAFSAPTTLTERYMFLTHQNDVYLFTFEPWW